MPYRLTEEAQNDLEDILFYGLITFGEYQALKYQASLYRTFELLADIPHLGRRSERHKNGEQRFVHNAHVIYYRVEDTIIVIENIIYGPLILDLWGQSD